MKTGKKDIITRISNLQGRRWILVIHGAAQKDLQALKNLFQQNKFEKAGIAYQTGEHGVHPHWQIYFQTVENCRMKQAITDCLNHDEFHIQLAKGTPRACIRYIYALDKQYQIGWVVFEKNCPPPRGYCERKKENLLRLHRGDAMQPWMTTLKNRLAQPTTFRSITWIWEPIGNTGKTYFAKYLHYFYGAILTGGKGNDMKYAIARWRQITGHYPVTIIIDLARSDYIDEDGYRTIEQIKNAIFFSGKYQSGMVASVEPPNILVFANVLPKKQNMSIDRWDIFRIENSELVPQLE